MSEQVSQVRNAEASAMHGGIKQRDGMGREEGSGWGAHVYL